MNQLVSMQGEIHEYPNEMGNDTALTNQIAYSQKSILKCVDSVIGNSSLKLQIAISSCVKQFNFLPQCFILQLNPFK